MKKIVICIVVGVTVVVVGLCVMCMLCRGNKCPLMARMGCGSRGACGVSEKALDVSDEVAVVADDTISRISAAIADSATEWTPQDVDKLFAFLGGSEAEDEGAKAEELNLKISVLRALADRCEQTDRVGQELVKIMGSADADIALRAQCIKLAGEKIEFLGEGATQKESLEIVWGMIDEDDVSLVKAALQALTANVGSDAVDSKKLSEKALTKLDDADTGTKRAALRACAVTGEERALPAARKMLDDSDDVTLQIAAVSALGKLGSATDKKKLQELVAGDNAHMASAAKSALRKIAARDN